MAEQLYWITLHFISVPNEVATECILYVLVDKQQQEIHRHIYVDAALAFGSYVNVAAILDRARPTCEQI